MPVVSRRQSERRRGDRFDLALLVSGFFTLRVRILLEQFFSPFADDCLRRILATPITKTADEYRIVIVDRSQREKGIFRVELFDLLQGLRSRVSFRKLSQRFSQKVLHCSFMAELVNVGVMPLIASSLEVRDVRKENRWAWKKRTH